VVRNNRSLAILSSLALAAIYSTPKSRKQLVEGHEIETEFGRAQAFAKTDLSGVDTQTQLKLYAYFKQATQGDCILSKPSVVDFAGRAKWDSWNELKGTDGSVAEQLYIDLVKKICPGWQDGAVSSSSLSSSLLNKNRSQTMGPVQSSLAPDNGDETLELTAADELFTLAGTGQVDKLEDALKCQDVNTVKGVDGESLLHMASDRGDMNMVEMLLRVGCLVDATDIDGLTPLAYAFMNEHHQLAVHLVKFHGANPSLKDYDEGALIDLCTCNETKMIIL